MERLTRWALSHRKLIAAVWIILTVVGIATAGKATKAMDQKFTVPGREGWETNQEIAKLYKGTGGDTAPLMPVVTLPQGKTAADPGVRAQLRAVEAKVAKTVPGARVAGFGSTGSRAFVSQNGRTAFVVAYPPIDPTEPFGGNPTAEKHVSAALKGRPSTAPPCT